MKLLVILCLEEIQERMASLLHNSGVTCMSVVPITGYRKSARCSAHSWFGRGSACEQASSMMMFSFTSDETAHKAIELIDQFNTEHPGDFPPRAYTLEVSEASRLLDNI